MLMLASSSPVIIGRPNRPEIVLLLRIKNFTYLRSKLTRLIFCFLPRYKLDSSNRRGPFFRCFNGAQGNKVLTPDQEYPWKTNTVDGQRPPILYAAPALEHLQHAKTKEKVQN
jgi:hypothetical protein